ncbi:MAG: VWA domain-containing protein [Planctomycetes bacterium]|nr:VWA domain-containing protein [Planctomycetota bacterium]
MNTILLANPSGLWWLAIAGVVVLLYLFHRRFIPKQATGLFLWGEPGRNRIGGAKAEPPPLSRRLFLDLAAALLLALAMAGIAVERTSDMPLVVIMDNSFSMHARDAHQHAAADAAALIDAESISGRPYALFVAGGDPEVVRGLAAHDGSADQVFRRYQPYGKECDFAAAVSLARELYGDGLDLHFFSNRDPVPIVAPGNRQTMHSYPGKGGNLAFARMWRETDAASGVERFEIGIRNYSSRPVSARLELRIFGSAENQPLHNGTVAIEAGELAAIQVELTGHSEAAISAELIADDDADVITEDSIAVVPPNQVRTVEYRIDGLGSADGEFFKLALEAAGCVPFLDNDPDSGENAAPPALLVTTDADAAGSALTLRCIAENNPVLAPQPLVADWASPLCRDLHLDGLAWAAAAELYPERMVAVYVSGGELPLFWLERPGALVLNLLPSRSDLVAASAWPVMAANIAAEARRSLPGVGKRLYSPGEMRVYNREKNGRTLNAPLRLVAADDAGEAVAESRFGAVAVPNKAGPYRLESDGTDLGLISVWPDYGGVSAAEHLAAEKSVVAATGDGTAGLPGRVDLSWLAVALAMALLFCNWRLSLAER